MNAQQAENLRILIRHMETRVTRRLDMSSFRSCGSPACALGKATAIGFRDCEGDIGKGDFGGTYEQRKRLFYTATQNAWRRNDVTPQEWAIEARKVLGEHGYSMDDGFVRFMDKVREPVSLGSYVTLK